MAKLKKELQLIYKDDVNVLNPRNCQTCRFNFLSHKNAKILGQNLESLGSLGKVRSAVSQYQFKNEFRIEKGGCALVNFRFL